MIKFWLASRATDLHLSCRCCGMCKTVTINIHHLRKTHRIAKSLRWRHDGRDSISNYQPHDCLLTVYSDADQRKYQSSASLAFVRGIHRGPVNSGTGEFPAQRASYAENVSIWWRHHGKIMSSWTDCTMGPSRPTYLRPSLQQMPWHFFPQALCATSHNAYFPWRIHVLQWPKHALTVCSKRPGKGWLLFCMVFIRIRRKIGFILTTSLFIISMTFIISLQTFARATTTQLSCNVQIAL